MLRRKAGMSREAFVQRYENYHAVLATKLVNDPAGGPAAPAAYQPRGGNSHAAE